MCCVSILDYELGIPQHRPFSCCSYVCHGEICHEISHHNIHKLCLAFTMLIDVYNQHNYVADQFKYKHYYLQSL